MITSGYFNSIDGDRKYNAEQMTMYFKGLVSDGVFANVGDQFLITPAGDLTVNVGSGRALVKTHWLENDAVYPLNFGAASVEYDRRDGIFLRCDLSENSREISILVKKGTPAASPTTPAVETETEYVKELRIGYVRIRANATTISQSDIVMEIGSSVCPWVTGLIEQVDISELFNQYESQMQDVVKKLENFESYAQSEFDAWFATLGETLQVNTKLNVYQWSETFTSPSLSSVTPDFGARTYETGDLLLVHVGGVLLVDGSEYTWSDGNIVFSTPLRPNPQTITAILIKSEVG